MVGQPQIQVTSEHFEVFLREHPNRLYELIHGEIVEKVVTEERGYIALNIGTEIRNYLKENRIGRTSVETSYRPKDDNLNDRLPDVSFRRTDSELVKRGPVLGMPDLAIEIKSPDDSIKQMRESATYYLANGCQMVWIVYPDKAMIEVYQQDSDIQILFEKDTLSGGHVLPDFEMLVTDVFA